MAGILLVLRRMHTCIIGNANDHTCVDAGIGNGKQGVCRHIQANVLHGAETALTCKAGTESSFHSNLFVRCPLSIDFFIGGYTFGDLGTGGAGVTGYKAAAGLKQTSGNGFVAKHQCFHIFHLLSIQSFLQGNQPVI